MKKPKKNHFKDFGGDFTRHQQKAIKKTNKPAQKQLDMCQDCGSKLVEFYCPSCKEEKD